MRRFVRALTQLIAAAGLVIGGIGVAQAAGALAIGSCGAYGFAYDYAKEAAAAQAALGKTVASQA